MAEISHVTLPDTNTYDITDANVPHSSLPAANGGADLSLVTTGEKYNWDNKADKVPPPPEYDPTSTYEVGDLVTYSSNIYQCKETIYTAEAWNSSHWDLVTPDTDYLHSINPNGYGTFSLNRKANTTIGECSFAEGYNCTASSNQGCHAEGYNTTASGSSAHAEGRNTRASGLQSHSEGNNTTASGHNGSHAEGRDTAAGGVSSHAEGSDTTASGNFSHSEGLYTIANHKSQHVFGEYNVVDPSAATASNRGNYVEIVGNGTATDARSNARTLDWSGNEVLAGTLTASGLSATTLNGVTIGATPVFTDTTYGLSTSGNDVILSANGTAQDTITIPYATSAGSATTATKLGTSTVGGTTTPIYLNAGVPTALSYTIAKSVPSNAVFTDTNNAVTQTATSTSADYEVLFSVTADNTTRTEGARKNSNLKFNPSTGNLQATKFNGYTLAAACSYGVATSVASGNGNLVTSGGVYSAFTSRIKRTQSNRYFNAKTTMSYTGLSLTCPSGHVYIVQAWFRYAQSAPRRVGASHANGTVFPFYDNVAASLDTYDCGNGSVTFMMYPGETIYYWAMYYDAKQNFITENILDITL